jgi:hypothetical protein
MPDGACDQCRIDFFGELLEGCIYYNVWKEVYRGVWRKIPEEDIEALKGMRRA